MECFVSKQGKSKGFLRVSGNAELRRGQNLDAGKGNRKLREDQRIVRTAARDNELVNLRVPENESVEGVDDRQCREEGGRTDEVVGLGSIAGAEGEEILYVGVAVVLAARGFWRSDLQVGIAQKLVEESGDTPAFGGEMGVVIEALAPSREMGDEGVDEHVRRASIEGEDLLRPGRRWKNRDVGDASEIERNAADLGMAIQEIVCVGHERRATAA